MTCMTLCGVVQLPVVNKLRTVHCNTQPGSYERAQAALPVLAELQEDLDGVLFCVGLNNVLMVGRLVHVNLPSAERLRTQYQQFKQRLMDDPVFMKRVLDVLPMIAANHSSSDIMDIVGDDEFLALLKP